MPLTRYKLVAAGPPGVVNPTHAGHLVPPPRSAHVAGVAKAAASPQASYVVTNEIICGQLGRVLGLPVPPGCMVTVDGVLHYVSLDFNLSDQPLPPVDASRFVAHDENLASALVVFDTWVLNWDRHEQNIFFNPLTKQVMVFDHGVALFGQGPCGILSLWSRRAKTDLGKHVIPPHLWRLDGIKRGIDRVQALPRFVVEDAVAAGVDTGITEDEASYCVDFLLDRAQRLPELFKTDHARFTGVKPELWDAF